MAPSPGEQRTWRVDAGAVGMWVLLAAGCAVVLPPFLYLVKTSLTVPLPGARTAIGLDNYARVAEIGGWDLWGVTLAFAAGASLFAVLFGASTAWLVVRTNVPFGQAAFVGAFLSLAAPPIVKGIGWILLLGPNNCLINNLLQAVKTRNRRHAHRAVQPPRHDLHRRPAVHTDRLPALPAVAHCSAMDPYPWRKRRRCPARRDGGGRSRK